MRKILIAAFILLALVQWWVPGKMIWEKDAVVTKGKGFRFETEPVDPADPFRGRYITLNFKLDTFTLAGRQGIALPQEVYVLLENDAQGFARIKDVTAHEPSNNHDYVKTNAFTSYQGNSYLVHIRWPFEKFYLDESKAPKAEMDFSRSLRESTQKTFALVKVYNGDAVIENVFINGKPLVR